jgi:4-hydroxy-4-methyl-2-oxoglutarate aldolase
VVREEEEQRLLKASRYLDSQECQTMIATARDGDGEVLERFEKAVSKYRESVASRFRREGEF